MSDRTSLHYWLFFNLIQWMTFGHTSRVKKAKFNKTALMWEEIMLHWKAFLTSKWLLYWHSQTQNTNKNIIKLTSVTPKPASACVTSGVHSSHWANPSWGKSIHLKLWILYSLLKDEFLILLQNFYHKIYTFT